MEQAETLFREGVLSHLDQLETLSHNLAVKQERSLREAEALQEKREAILQLKKERDELRTKVTRQEEQIRALSVKAEGSRPRGPNTKKALLGLKLEGVTGMMEALWFTGISGKKTDHGMCFCLSTAFEGHYLGSYYIEVNNLERPQIGRHCIPVVIPLAEISAAHLQTSLKKFLSLLFDHINAFAGRKYQADRLQDSPGACVPGTLRKNSLHTVLTFSYNVTLHGQNLLFSAKLLYRDVTAVLPTEALVTCPENVESAQEAASSHSSLFRRMPLHRALESLAKEEDTPSFS